MRNRIVATILAGLLFSLNAGAATTVIGTVADASGGLLANGTIQFKLSQEGTVTDPLLLLQNPTITCTITTGVITACSVRGNDEISPAGTVYEVQIFDADGITLLPARTYSITGATWDIGTQTPNPSSVQTGIHGASLHSGDVIPPANQEFGAFYSDFGEIAVPANPGANVRRLFVNSATEEISVRTSAGTTVSLETGGGGGATHQIDAVGLTSQDPINFLDTSEFDWTNPAAGNLSLALKATGIADSKLAQITTASKVSGAALTSLGSVPAGAGDLPLANLTDGTGFLKGAGGAGTPAYAALVDADIPDTISLVWNALIAPTAATTFLSGAIAETLDFDFQAAFTAGTQFAVRQTTGNPTGGTLFGITVNDPNVLPFAISDGTNTVFQVERNADTTIRNLADQTLNLQLDSGSTAGQSARITFADRGVNKWRYAKGANNNFSVEEIGVGFRLIFNPAGNSVFRSGSTTHDFTFANITPTTRFTIHGDADKISWGASADVSLERTSDPNTVLGLAVTAGSVFGLPVVAGDPNTATWGTGQDGRAWFNSTTNLWRGWDGSAVQTIGPGGAGDGVGYDTVGEEGADLTKRAVINFVGPAITAVDDAVGVETDVTVVASGIGDCGAGNFVRILNDGAAPTCAADVSGGSPALSGITAAITGNTINSGDNAQVWNWSLTTASKVAFKFGENVASTAITDPIILNAVTLAASTAHPFQATARGTANGVRVGATDGILIALGTGGLDWPGLLNYPTGCTNQFVRTIADTLTCNTVDLTADVTGTLPVGNGGTGAGAFTLGSVVFAGASGVYTQDNANLFWDNTNNRLGIGTTSPLSSFHIVLGDKIAAGEQARWNIGTDDAPNSMEMAMRIFGGATAADRYVDIQSIEQGVAPRALVFQPGGGNVGVNDTTPESLVEIVGTLNALADLAVEQNYHLKIRNSADVDGEGVGISFGMSSTDSQQTAAIVSRRTGANGQGTLQFYTKQSTVAGVAPVLALTLTEAGKGDFIGAITEEGNAVPNSTDNLSFFATTTSLQFIGVISDETGTGLSVFNATPTIITPSFTTGFTIGGAAATNDCVLGNATNFVAASTCVLDGDSPNAAGDISGTYTAGLTIDAGAVASAELATANKTFKCNFVLFRDTGLKATDDINSISNCSRPGRAITLTEVHCETDTGSPVINLQRDDGTPTNILSSNLTCTTGGANGTLAAAEDNIAATDKIDFVMVTAAGNRTSVLIEYTVD